MAERVMRRRLKHQREDAQSLAENFTVKFIDTYIGYGVFAKDYIPKGLQLMEYKGILRSYSPCDDEDETFKYYFNHNGKSIYIDATNTKGLGRMVNDSAKPNCKVKKIVTDKPRLWLYSLKEIHPGEQLFFDYGVKDAPWRRRKKDDVKPVLYEKPKLDIQEEGEETMDSNQVERSHMTSPSDLSHTLPRPSSSSNLNQRMTTAKTHDMDLPFKELDIQEEGEETMVSNQVERSHMTSPSDLSHTLPRPSSSSNLNQLMTTAETHDMDLPLRELDIQEEGEEAMVSNQVERSHMTSPSDLSHTLPRPSSSSNLNQLKTTAETHDMDLPFRELDIQEEGEETMVSNQVERSHMTSPSDLSHTLPRPSSSSNLNQLKTTAETHDMDLPFRELDIQEEGEETMDSNQVERSHMTSPSDLSHTLPRPSSSSNLNQRMTTAETHDMDLPFKELDIQEEGEETMDSNQVERSHMTSPSDLSHTLPRPSSSSNLNQRMTTAKTHDMDLPFRELDIQEEGEETMVSNQVERSHMTSPSDLSHTLPRPSSSSNLNQLMTTAETHDMDLPFRELDIQEEGEETMDSNQVERSHMTSPSDLSHTLPRPSSSSNLNQRMTTAKTHDMDLPFRELDIQEEGEETMVSNQVERSHMTSPSDLSHTLPRPSSSSNLNQLMTTAETHDMDLPFRELDIQEEGEETMVSNQVERSHMTSPSDLSHTLPRPSSSSNLNQLMTTAETHDMDLPFRELDIQEEGEETMVSNQVKRSRMTSPSDLSHTLPRPSSSSNLNQLMTTAETHDMDLPFRDSRFWGFVFALKSGREFATFPMTSTVLSIGSASTNDIIVKKAGTHEILIQVNQLGQAFLTPTQTKDIKYLQNNDVFDVGGRSFKWMYPSSKDISSNDEIDSNEDNDSNEENDNDGKDTVQMERLLKGKVAVVHAFCGQNKAPASKAHTMIGTEDVNLSDYDDDNGDPDYVPSSSDVTDNEMSDSTEKSEITPETSSELHVLYNTTEAENQHSKSKIILQGNAVSSGKSSTMKSYHTQRNKNENNKRVWDKLHFCVFCETSSTNLTKHFFGPHKKEAEVSKILSFPKSSNERSLALLKLRNAGDYKHNIEVLKSGTGTLVTWSRKPENADPDDYLPCEDCLAFFLKNSLWRHRKVCPLKSERPSGRKVQATASLLLPSSETASTRLKQHVLKKMASDEVTIAVRNDWLILKVGEKMFQKQGHLPHLNNYISQKMRELGRLLIHAKELNTDIQSLKDLISPDNFLVVIEATRILCKYDQDLNRYCNPSLAMKLGHLLKKCTRIKKSEALISGHDGQCKEADDFLSLVEHEWTDEISSAALQTMTADKLNKGQMLPLTEDIMRLQAYLRKKTETMTVCLRQEFSQSSWELLNQATLARLVMFNRRRGGETERITLEAYKAKVSRLSALNEVEESLTPVERILCNTFSRVEIRGKKGRTVPVLITPELQESIDLLLRWRKEAGITKQNIYVFPRPNFASKNPLRSSDVLRTFAECSGLKMPQNITSTRLRKHIATVSQILNLTKNDLEVMAQFMGHDIDVHKSFYRLPQETIQVVKMGRLLSAFDKGTVSKYSGKSLDDIPVDDPDDEDVVNKEMDSVEDDSEDDKIGLNAEASIYNTSSLELSHSPLRPTSNNYQRSLAYEPHDHSGHSFRELDIQEEDKETMDYNQVEGSHLTSPSDLSLTLPRPSSNINQMMTIDETHGERDLSFRELDIQEEDQETMDYNQVEGSHLTPPSDLSLTLPRPSSNINQMMTIDETHGERDLSFREPLTSARCHGAASQTKSNPHAAALKTKERKPRKNKMPVRLSEDQSRLLKSHFKVNVDLRKELRRGECEKVIIKYPCLKDLTWTKIKNTIHNWITREKRKLKSLD